MDWRKEYSVGVARLDADHRELFEIVNEFRYHTMADHGYSVDDSDAGFLETVIVQLIKYTERHFQHEEAYMREIGFPALDDHHEKHVAMVEKLGQLRKQLGEGHTELVKEVAELLNHWWSEHILAEDMAYVAFANKEVMPN